MSDFETHKLVRNLIGLEFIGGNRQRRFLKFFVPICVSVVMVSFLLSITFGSLFNEHGFIKSVVTVCGIFGVLTAPLVYWQLLFNYERICSLLGGLQDIVDENCK